MEKQTKQNYIMVDGQRVYLSQSQQKAWDKLINDTRNDARRTKSCMQPDYRLCIGDCGLCAWRGEGILVSVDDENFEDSLCHAERASLSIESPENQLLEKDTMARLLTYAREAYPGGDRILELALSFGYSSQEISDITGIPYQTANRRLKMMLEYIRVHRSYFFE